MQKKANSQIIVPHQKSNVSKQFTPSLYDKFDNHDVTYMISEYLSPEVPNILIENPCLNNSAATEKETHSIKDFLRTYYWIEITKKDLPQKAFQKMSMNQFAVYNALKYATHNKFGQDTLEITALAVACGADINRNIVTGEIYQENSLRSLLQQVGSIIGYKRHYEKLLQETVNHDSVPGAKLLLAAGFKAQLVKHVNSQRPAIKIINYLIDQNQ